MFIYRITLTEYADRLQASGVSGRWNSNGMYVIYTSSSKALACLENVVHRSSCGLNRNFRVLTIDIPELLRIETVPMESLPEKWDDPSFPFSCRILGDKWVKQARTSILKVPSAIISGEYNYLLNPEHPDFGNIKLVKSEKFLFDERIKNMH